MFSAKDFKDFKRDRAGLAPDEYFFVNYRVQANSAEYGLSRDDLSVFLGVITSLGTHPALQFENSKSRLEAAALVTDCDYFGEDRARIEIAYPARLGGKNEGITQLISVCAFAAEFGLFRSIWIDRIELPKGMLQDYSGPTFGITGLRNHLDVDKRPLTGLIVKPRGGVNFSKLENYFEAALLGGMDMIVDDELIVDPPGNWNFEQRAQLMSKVTRKCTSITRRKKSFVMNISSSPRKMEKLFRVAKSMGAAAVFVNSFSVGLGALHEFATIIKDDPLPIFECGIGNALLSRPPHETGMSDVTLTYLTRLAGADAICTGIPGNDVWYSKEVLRRTITTIASPLHHIKPSMCIAAGGIRVSNIFDSVHTMGEDTVFLIGRGIWGYSTGNGQADIKAAAECLSTISASALTMEQSELGKNELARLISKRCSPEAKNCYANVFSEVN